MARTLDPNAVLDEFKSSVAEAKSRHDTIQRALATSGAELSVRKGATVDFVFRLGGELELFQHRWHIACISKRPATLLKRLSEALEKDSDALAKTHRHAESLLAPSPRYPKRLTASVIEDLLDESGRNISFPDMKAWRSTAKRDLVSAHESKVTRLSDSQDDAFVMELLRATRNAIAHSSDSSLVIFNDRVARLSTPSPAGGTVTPSANLPLRRGGTTRVRSVATYLHGSYDKPGRRRCDVLASRTLEAVERLRL